MTSERPSLVRARRTLMLFAVTLAAILYLDRVCISQTAPLISHDLGLTKKQMGLAMMMFGLAYAIFEVPGGWLGDRFGPRAILTRVVVWWSTFTIATGWARGIASLATIRFLFGAGEAGCFPNLTRAFSSWFQGHDRTRVQSIMWLAARWGGAFTPLIVVAVLEYATWRQSFYLFGSIGFIWAFFFYRWFRNTPAQHPHVDQADLVGVATMAAPTHGREAGAPWRRFFGSPSVWFLSFQYACQSYGFWFYVTWLPTYIKEQFHLEHADRYLSAILAAPPLFLGGISCILTGLLTPWLVRKLGSIYLVRRLQGVTGHAMACVMLIVSISLNNPILAMIAMGFSAFGNDIAMPPSWAAVMDMGGRYSGTLSGIMNTFGSVGGLLAPFTIPYILELGGNNWHVPILVISGVYFLGSLSWLGINPVSSLDWPEESR